MSQEIQLSLTPSSPGQQPAPWAGSGGGTLAKPASQESNPFLKVHQHLRGRYLVTLMIAGVFGLIGGAAGFLAFHSSYQSMGSIEIDPVIPRPELADQIMPLWQAYVATVQNNLHSERVIRAAMEDANWKEHRKLPPEAYLSQWSKGLTVKLAPGSFIINITYVDDGKDGKIMAPVAVTALINAYDRLYGKDEKAQYDRKIDVWKSHDTTLSQKIKNDNDLIDQMLQNVGDNPQVVLEKMMETHFALQKQVRDLEEELRVERDELAQAQAQAGTTPYTIEDFSRVDLPMAEMYRIEKTEELTVQEMESRLGRNHPVVISARTNAQLRLQMMNNYAQTLRDKYFIRMKPDGSGGVLVAKDLSVKESNLKHWQERYSNEQQLIEDLGHRAHQVANIRTEKLRLEEERIRVEKKIEELQNVKDMAQTFAVIDYGGHATQSTTKPLAFGALGFMAGGGFPVGLMLLASLMNPRFRFSDETASQQTAGLALLGILPDLPDRLSDPEQASIAAHCVHQIRTMLQINTGGTDDRRVFAVTSAAPADGKTSLTLALGLSYAACGTRTLLIDCDLIGAGLTSRLNITAQDGVLEAIAHRTLLEYVRSTDIADVSILPVGNAQHLHASTLSPAALRRLIEEAKKHFDTILIDTGPVMGSIEASLVAAAADAVVLTVSRGQQRPLVERTVEHLRNLNAKLAGVVFNRAQTEDFDSSISGISLRSAAAGTGHNIGRMGPVARAVQSAFRPAGEEVN